MPRSFDETVTIEELYDASDYMEWLGWCESRDEVDRHWDEVNRDIESEATVNRYKHEPLPF